jgi:zinc protease
LAVETKRAREFGFHASELDRAKRSMAAVYERSYNERDKTESGSYAREYVAHFLTGEPSPGIAYEYQLVQALLPGITLDEVAATARTKLSDRGGVVLAVSPEKPSLPLPTDPEIRAALTSADRVSVTPWPEATTALTLMDVKPSPGRVESRRELPDLGVTVVRLANGVEAWLKPTDFKNDQVVFSMYALGGTSLAAPEDFLEASFATSYVELSGWGGLKALELERLLAGKRASASPFISLSTHGVSGSAAPTELETALQLLHQAVTAPGDDPEAFALLKRQLDASVANRGQSPGQVFGERVAEINSSGHYTARPVTAEDVAALDRGRMTAFYRERFSNAADFTLFVVGAFQPDALVPLLSQYVGSLPSTGKRTSQFKDLGIRFPVSIVREQVAKGREPRANSVVSFFADPPPDPMEAEQIVATTTILEILLRDLLREELGQTYTVGVRLAQSLPQRGSGYVQVSFGAAPENIQAMSDRVLKEVGRLQNEGPADELTARAKESARRGYETALEQNGYWLGRLQTVHMLAQNPSDILTRLKRIEAVTPATVRETVRKYFPLDRYTVVTLVPEPTAAGQP